MVLIYQHLLLVRASQVVLVVKNLPATAGDMRDLGLIPGMRRSPGERNGNPLHYSFLENYKEGTPVSHSQSLHGVTKGHAGLSTYILLVNTSALCPSFIISFQIPFDCSFSFHFVFPSSHPPTILIEFCPFPVSFCVASSQNQFSLVQSLSCVWLFVTPQTAARQVSLSITNSRSLLSLMSVLSVLPATHLILCFPGLLFPSIFLAQGLFQWVSSSHQVAKVLEFQLQHQSFQWISRTANWKWSNKRWQEWTSTF